MPTCSFRHQHRIGRVDHVVAAADVGLRDMYVAIQLHHMGGQGPGAADRDGLIGDVEHVSFLVWMERSMGSQTRPGCQLESLALQHRRGWRAACL